jgi:hypothetical protein
MRRPARIASVGDGPVAHPRHETPADRSANLDRPKCCGLEDRVSRLESGLTVERRPLAKGLMTVPELREALRFSSADAVRTWLRRHRVPCFRRRRIILAHGYDVERVLRKLGSV